MERLIPNSKFEPPNSDMPERTCIACRRKGEQGSFLRVARHAEGRVALLGKGLQPRGRSAYLCNAKECIEKGLTKGRLARALRQTVDEEELNRLREELNAN